VLVPAPEVVEPLLELPALEPIVSDVEEPELIVPGEVPEVVESEREPAPEPAPEPMLPEVVSRGVEEDGDEVDERLLLDCELLLSVSRELLFAHFENSDCVSVPSLSASALVNAPLSSVCIAASVCEMRPSRFASSVEKEAVPASWLELVAPIVLLGVDELLWP
jgi:hypothetical protein